MLITTVTGAGTGCCCLLPIHKEQGTLQENAPLSHRNLPLNEKPSFPELAASFRRSGLELSCKYSSCGCAVVDDTEASLKLVALLLVDFLGLAQIQMGSSSGTTPPPQKQAFAIGPKFGAVEPLDSKKRTETAIGK